MKIWLVGSIAAFGLILGAVAQDPPGQSSETVAKPKKKADPNATTPDDTSENLPKIPSKLSTKSKDETSADVNFKADTSVVSIDVAVLDNKGNPIPKIPRDNFRMLEDNVPQKLTQYATSQAPLTVAMVIEFSARYQSYWSMGWRDTLNASYGFMQTLRPDDYLAVIAYDLRTDILCDFTNDHGKIQEALGRLRIPGFSESNMFDAITETADRMQKIEGRKAILLITSGIDTFSKLTYDKTRKSLQESAVPIYSIGILQFARTLAESRGSLSGAQDVTFLQGDNELRTFAKETGGQAFFPRFPGEMGSVFAQINQSLRNQYSLGYSPTNQAKDGKFRKITIQLVDPRTNEPLKVTDEKNKPIKYSVIAKAGYTAPRAVE